MSIASIPLSNLQLSPSVPPEVLDLLLAVASRANHFLPLLSLPIAVSDSVPQLTCQNQGEHLIVIDDAIRFSVLKNAETDCQKLLCVTILDLPVSDNAITLHYLASVYRLLSMQLHDKKTYALFSKKLIHCLQKLIPNCAPRSNRELARALGVDPAVLRTTALISKFQPGE